MTAYFDAIGAQLAALDPYGAGARADLRDIELTLVHDVSVCCAFPGFPADLRDAIDRTIILGGIYTQPRRVQQADPATWGAHRDQLYNLNGDLHTIFHQLGQLGLPRFSDSPTCPVRCLAADAENRRDNTAAALVLFDRLLPWLRGGAL